MKPEPRIIVLGDGDLLGDWTPNPVTDAVNRLPDREATIIRQAYLGDRKQPDRVIADNLGIDRSRVTRIRHRALEHLAEQLDP